MKVSAEKTEKNKAQITVEIPEDEFETSLQMAYKTVIKKVNIPGFRKGKAPRRILENMYGKEILLEEAIQDAVPKAYIKALLEIKDEYVPVSEPQYELVQTEIGKPVIFKASFDLKPEVKLGQYKGIEIEKTPEEVTDELVDAELSKMQQRYAKLVVVDGPAEDQDVLTIDFVGKVDGQPFEGGTAENHLLTLGSGSFIPGFEEQLLGIKTGDEKDVTVTFPEEYHAKELQGKEAVFTVAVKEIKRKELAPLDDEFAKDVSEFETLQELRQDTKNKLEEAVQKRAQQELREAAISKVSANAEVEIPQSMIDNRINRMIEDFDFRLRQQGMSLDYYLKATGNQLQDMIDAYRPGAEQSVRTDLVLEEIIKVEGIKAPPEDVDKEIQRIAEQFKQEPDKVRETLEKQGQISSLEFGIMIDKAVDLIISEAKIIISGEQEI